VNLVAWGRLLRLSLAPSAAADALAGMTLGAWGAFPLDARAALLPLASLCVFHGGMALNDWTDRAADARTRPDRPIPSGAVPARAALWIAILLLSGGPALAHAVAPAAGLCLAAVAATAALYDVAGRGAWLGPTLLGLCRGGNLAAGVIAGVALSGVGFPPPWAVAACIAYGAYVFFASRLARLEDDEDERALGARPVRAAVAASFVLAFAPWLVVLLYVPEFLPHQGWLCGTEMLSGYRGPLQSTLAIWALAPAALLAAGSALLLAGEAWRNEPWTRARVGRTAGMALRRLLVFSAAMAWCAPLAGWTQDTNLFPKVWGGWVLAPLLLLGYPIALRLRRVFPPT
jgi:4-hydroxybenzoate polyprenyltransferase